VRLDDLPAVHQVPSVTAAQMAEVDRITTLELGVSVARLMENASRQVAHTARVLLGGRVAGKRIIGLVGSGNNGADTAGALRHLINWGAAVVPAIAAPKHRLREDTLRDVTRLSEYGRFQASHFIDASLGLMPAMAADLLLDGLLGYSAQGPPRTEMARLIEAANANGAPILAVDIPTGIDPDSGAATGVAIRATATVTFALPKTGVLSPASRAAVGTLILADIGIPPGAFARIGLDTHFLFTDGDLLRVSR
jgi:NAD(P)H-hydrate epimerase